MAFKDKVLAVDDDPSNLKIYEEVLGDQCHFKFVSSGEEALKQIPRFKPDVVLLDVMMPGINGYETCQRIKNDPELKFTKILMVSAKAMANDRLTGYDIGADDYITKPFNDDELLAKVKVYLKLKFLEELEELRSNTLEAMSQNIKRPLTSMLGAISSLTEGKADLMERDHLESQLQSIRQSGQKLAEFCNKAMLLCELKDGKDVKNESVNISDVVQEALKSFDTEVADKQIQVIYGNEVKSEINADHQLLVNALQYILQNAITYSPTHSKIIISSVEEDGQCIISCEDQGVGLVQRVFKETLSNENNSYRSGEGVGINVAEIIAKLHGGKLSYQNIPNGGIKFSLTIPMKMDRQYQG